MTKFSKCLGDLASLFEPIGLSGFEGAMQAVHENRKDYPLENFTRCKAFNHELSNFDNVSDAEVVASFDICAVVLDQICADQIAQFEPDAKPIEPGPECLEERAILSILLYMRELKAGVLVTTDGDLDLPARVLARSLVEASDLLIAFLDDEKLAADWVAHQDSNRDFWYKNLSGDKLSKKRSTALKRMFRSVSDQYSEYSRFRKEEFHDFSMASHPSYLAGAMTIFQAVGLQDNEETFWSKRTYRYCISAVSLAIQSFVLVLSKKTTKAEREGIPLSAYYLLVSLALIMATAGLRDPMAIETIRSLVESSKTPREKG